MNPAVFQFGPFVVNRAQYRITRDGIAIELTPKLLDLLIHLADHAGELVTKEALLDALWADANVTDNALTQAISELRDALGDSPTTPAYIKTVARRGYRFIGTIEVSEPPAAVLMPVATAPPSRGVAVLNFVNVTGDAETDWLSAGIAETVTADLRALGQYHVIDRSRVQRASERAEDAERIAAAVNARYIVTGSFQRIGDRLRVTGRLLDTHDGSTVADAKVDGAMAEIFALQDQIVAAFARHIEHQRPLVRTAVRDTSSLDAYRALTEGWLKLEALDVRLVDGACTDFERAIALDPRYAQAHAGLANAELVAYEDTRCLLEPDAPRLARALDQARQAVALDDGLAEAHGTLGMILVSAWKPTEAIAATRRAVALEPSNWRHLFRLGHASWGAARLDAANSTLALYPDFAFAHFQMAMVHVARGHLTQAESVLNEGAAIQDRQTGRADRYPPLGLHWLRGLLHLAADATDRAIDAFEREFATAAPERLYGREYQMAAQCGRAAALLRRANPEAALAAARSALTLNPGYPQAHLHAAIAERALGREGDALDHLTQARVSIDTLQRTRPIEAAIAGAQLSAVEQRASDAAARLGTLLTTAPPGFAAWTLPIEPLLRQLIDNQALSGVLRKLAERAR